MFMVYMKNVHCVCKKSKHPDIYLKNMFIMYLKYVKQVLKNVPDVYKSCTMCIKKMETSNVWKKVDICRIKKINKNKKGKTHSKS